MRSPFTTLPERRVTITRATGETGSDGKPVTVELVLTLRPYPLGYPEKVGTLYPPPVRYVNAVEEPDPTLAEDYQTRRALIILAKCLGDQMEAREPASRDRREWHAYTDAIWRELEGACLVAGDVQRLIAEAQLVSRGVGVLGKSTGDS